MTLASCELDEPALYLFEQALFRHIDIDAARMHLPHGKPDCLEAEADCYEATIAESGGISLQLLGIGRNGRIGFNEPTSSLTSRTRVKTLTETTRQSNRQYFSADEETPRYAITMGIGTILAARECLLLATGANKAQAVAEMIEGPVSAICPASALQSHPNATVTGGGRCRDAPAEGALKPSGNGSPRKQHPTGTALSNPCRAASIGNDCRSQSEGDGRTDYAKYRPPEGELLLRDIDSGFSQ